MGWPMFQGNTSLAGVAQGAIPAHFHVLWSAQVPVGPNLASNPAPYQASPIVSQGQVIVASGDTLTVLNATTGVTIMSIDLSSALGGAAVPYVATPTIVAPMEVAVSQGGATNLMGLFSLQTGALLRTCNPGSVDGGAIPLKSGTFAVATGSGNIYGPISATSCGGNWGGHQGGSAFLATPSLSWSGGTDQLWIPDHGNGQIDVYSLATQAYSSNIGITGTVDGSMSVANLTNGTASALPYGFVGQAGPGALLVMNLTSVAISATLLTAHGVDTTPAVRALPGGTDAQVFFGNGSWFSGATFGLGASGPFVHTDWNFTGNGTFSASPALAGGLVVDGDNGGGFYAWNASTGAEVWHLRFPGQPIYASPAVAGSMVYVLTSSGTLDALSLAAAPSTLAVQDPVLSGVQVPVNVTVLSLNDSGVASGPLVGARVDLKVCGGSLATPTLYTGGTGLAQFFWTPPQGITSPLDCGLQATISPAGYSRSIVQARTQVDPVPAPGLLLASVTTGASQVAPSGSTVVSVLARSPGGSPVVGATVQLTLVGAGTLASSFGTTPSNGTFFTTYTAPATTPASPGVLLFANVSSPGYLAVQNATALVIAPPSTYALSATVLPVRNLTVSVGQTAGFEVEVTNGSSGAHPPVIGATVSVTGTPSGLGTFTACTPTSAAGTAYCNFTASLTPGAVLALVQATAPGFATAGISSLAIAILAGPSGQGSLVLNASIAGTVWSGTSVPIDLTGTATPASGGPSAAAAGATVTLSLVAGTGTLSATSTVLNAQGLSGAVSFQAPKVEARETVVLALRATLSGYAGAGASLVLTVEPVPLSLAPSFSSATFVPGSGSTLVVSVSDRAGAVAGAWVNATVVQSGAGVTTVGPPASLQSTSTGSASFSVHWNGSAGQSVTLELQASAPGHAPAWSNITVTLSSAPQSTTTPSGSTFSPLSLLLFALMLLFLVAFVIALFRPDRRPAARSMPKRSRPSSPKPAAVAEPAATGAPAERAPPEGAVPPHEFDEDVENPGVDAVAGDAAVAVAAPPLESEEPAGPPTPLVSPPPSPPEVEMTDGRQPRPSSEGTSGPSAQAGETHAEGATGGSEGAEGLSAGGAEATSETVHLETERTLGEERLSVEEASPYGDQLTPEEVNPNVVRIPKKLLQPTEMRISGDEKASDRLPEVEDAERRRADEERRQQLVEKSRRLKQASRPKAPEKDDD